MRIDISEMDYELVTAIARAFKDVAIVRMGRVYLMVL